MSHVVWAFIGVAVIAAIVLRVALQRRSAALEMGSVSVQWIAQHNLGGPGEVSR